MHIFEHCYERQVKNWFVKIDTCICYHQVSMKFLDHTNSTMTSSNYLQIGMTNLYYRTPIGTIDMIVVVLNFL